MSWEPGSNRYLAGFMAMSILAGIANGTAKVLLPLFAAALHASSSQIGLVGGLQFLGLLLLSLPIGSLLERIDPRIVFRIGGLGGAAVYALLFPAIAAPWQLILCVLIYGLFNPLRMVTTQTEFLHMLHTFDQRKAGWNRAAHTSGMFFLGPTLGAAVLSALGFAAAFQISAIALLIAVLLGGRILSSLPARVTTSPTPVAARLRGFLAELRSRADLRRSIAVEFIGQVAMSYFSVFVVIIGIQQFGMSTQAAATLITVQGACFVGVLFALGGVLAPLAEATRYALSFAILLLAQACLMLATSPWMLAAGAILLGIGLGIQHLTSVTRFAALARELGRGRIGGLFTVSGPAGGVCGAMGGGFIGQHFGLAAGFRILFALYLLQLAVALHRRGLGTSSGMQP